jgi:3-hydroxyacyl-CoA dehydrogenase
MSPSSSSTTPPINAGSTEVRRGLLEAVEMVRCDDAIVAAVLIGAGTTFIAGSDIREFGQPLAEPQLPAVIAAIEACTKPFVAALHGAALGGGFELALGCDARVAAPGTVVGLPEVTLGIIPGAGGTQRLPRIVGVPRAIQMVCSGERVASAAALATGLIDVQADGDLRAAAVAHARRLVGPKAAPARPSGASHRRGCGIRRCRRCVEGRQEAAGGPGRDRCGQGFVDAGNRRRASQ